MAQDSFLKISNKLDFSRFGRLNKVIFDRALKAGAIQMLDWSANGSSKVSAKPPIRAGILKGSGSAFVGGKLVDTTATKFPPKEGTPTPNKTHNAKKNTITIGYNTDYAVSMHENKLNPGPFSKQAGNSNPGNQWLDKHLKGDGELLMKTIGAMMKSELKK